MEAPTIEWQKVQEKWGTLALRHGTHDNIGWETTFSDAPTEVIEKRGAHEFTFRASSGEAWIVCIEPPATLNRRFPKLSEVAQVMQVLRRDCPKIACRIGAPSFAVVQENGVNPLGYAIQQVGGVLWTTGQGLGAPKEVWWRRALSLVELINAMWQQDLHHDDIHKGNILFHDSEVGLLDFEHAFFLRDNTQELRPNFGRDIMSRSQSLTPETLRVPNTPSGGADLEVAALIAGVLLLMLRDDRNGVVAWEKFSHDEYPGWVDLPNDAARWVVKTSDRLRTGRFPWDAENHETRETAWRDTQQVVTTLLTPLVPAPTPGPPKPRQPRPSRVAALSAVVGLMVGATAGVGWKRVGAGAISSHHAIATVPPTEGRSVDVPAGNPDPEPATDAAPSLAWSCAPNMVLVGGGPAVFGEYSAPWSARSATTQHLPEFCIDRYEVTVEQFRACVDAGQCAPPPGTIYSTEDILLRDRLARLCNVLVANGPANQARHPINCINWLTAHDCCRWRGMQLPTEGQWERAARGTSGARYPWGDGNPTDGLLNLCGEGCQAAFARGLEAGGARDRDGALFTAAVGGYPPGLAGAYDLAGNVAEWTDTLVTGFEGAAVAEDRRVVRGGSFADALDARTCEGGSCFRGSHRWAFAVSTRLPMIGFRCVAIPRIGTETPIP